MTHHWQEKNNSSKSQIKNIKTWNIIQSLFIPPKISYEHMSFVLRHMFWSLFISCMLPSKEPAWIACDDEQGHLFYSKAHGKLFKPHPMQASSSPTSLYDYDTLTLLADSEKRIQAFKTKCKGKLLCISYQQLGAEQDQLPYGPTGTSSGNCQEMETGMFEACHMSPQPLQKHQSGHLGGWTLLWSAQEMLDGQHQRVDIPAYAITAHKGFLRRELEEDLCWIIPHLPPPPQLNQSRDWTEYKE